MSLEIYKEQEKPLGVARPFNYMPDDIIYRLPWWMGPTEPPLSVLYPLIYKTWKGKEIIDPLTIRIGFTAEGKRFAYNPRYVVNPLVFVVGTPGAGKSATMMTFVYNLLSLERFADGKAPPVVIVDPEGEYARVGKALGVEKMLHLKLGVRDYINIFDRPSKAFNPFSWYIRLLAVLEKFLGITAQQAGQAFRVLNQAIREVARQKGITEDPETWNREDITLYEVYSWITNAIEALEKKGKSGQKMDQKERVFYRSAVTLQSRLASWMYPPNDAFSHKSTVDLSKIFDYKLVVLDARRLAKDLFGVFTYWIVYWMYGLMLEKGPLPTFGIRVVLILDEAWSLIQKTKGKEENPPGGPGAEGPKVRDTDSRRDADA